MTWCASLLVFCDDVVRRCLVIESAPPGAFASHTNQLIPARPPPPSTPTTNAQHRKQQQRRCWRLTRLLCEGAGVVVVVVAAAASAASWCMMSHTETPPRATHIDKIPEVVRTRQEALLPLLITQKSERGKVSRRRGCWNHPTRRGDFCMFLFPYAALLALCSSASLQTVVSAERAGRPAGREGALGELLSYPVRRTISLRRRSHHVTKADVPSVSQQRMGTRRALLCACRCGGECWLRHCRRHWERY